MKILLLIGLSTLLLVNCSSYSVRDRPPPPSRIYSDTSPDVVYGYLEKILQERDYRIVERDRMNGRLLAEKPEEIYKEALIWKWKRKDVTTGVIRSSLASSAPNTVLHLYVKRHDKRPLSRDYSEDQAYDERSEKSAILTELDKNLNQ